MDWKKVLIVGLAFITAALVGISKAQGKEPSAFGQGAYLNARSVRICAVAENQVQKCGTGVFIGKNTILTAWHVVSPALIMEPKLHFQPAELWILRDGATKFEPAVLDYPIPSLDIAVIRGGNKSPWVPMHDTFFRGEHVWVAGNPSGRDFQVVETTIVGVELMPGKSGELVEMIALDDKDHRITHGFSGGAVYSNWGLIGITQLCSEEASACLAMPTRVFRSELHQNQEN